MWQTILEHTKLIVGTITAVAIFAVGTWDIVTNVFITRAEAQVAIKKLDLDTSYNKAFRIEEKIRRMKRKQRPLDIDENRTLKRLEKDLQRTDDHIDFLEEKIYDEVKDD